MESLINDFLQANLPEFLLLPDRVLTNEISQENFMSLFIKHLNWEKAIKVKILLTTGCIDLSAVAIFVGCSNWILAIS